MQRVHSAQLTADITPNSALVVIIYAPNQTAQIIHNDDVYSLKIGEGMVLDACALMDREYAHIDGVGDVADRLGVTKAYLIRVFKNALDITPGHITLGRYGCSTLNDSWLTESFRWMW